MPTSEVTYVTRGRGHVRAAAIVPADWVEAYETMLDREDGSIAAEQLRKVRAGETAPIPAERIEEELEL
ncbi:MAG: antitoxin of toxin-antitoxin stability system [Actinomycetota bacterium]|nr:antitoxin of toxin-antitoxin stability system [Actinomycetota bacterium]